MTIFDYAVLAILVLSILLSVVRGVVRELLSLAGWVIAFMVASSFAAAFSPMLPSAIIGDQFRGVLAFASIFLSALLAMGLLTMLISALVKTAGLGFADRFMGSLFGFARGMLVVLLAVLAAGFTTVPQEPFWKKAMLSAPLETVAMMIIPWLPQDVTRHINYVKSKRD
jgi:membrane protein required for colicin V production